MKMAPKNDVEEGKDRLTLLPMDIISELLIPAYEEGVDKYYRESWRRGFKVSKMIDAAKRHIKAFYYDGEDIDEDSITKKHHLGGAIFSLLSAYHSLKYYPELDDRRDLTNGEFLSKQKQKPKSKQKLNELQCPYDMYTLCHHGSPCSECDIFEKIKSEK